MPELVELCLKIGPCFLGPNYKFKSGFELENQFQIRRNQKLQHQFKHIQ